VKETKTATSLILGIGNPILADDGVGIQIARRMKDISPDVAVAETYESGLALLDIIPGYERLIVVDSIKTDDGKPGDVYKLELEDLSPAMDFTSLHGISIATVLELGRMMGMEMPARVSIYAVEIEDCVTFSEKCTRQVGKRIPLIIEQIIEEEKL